MTKATWTPQARRGGMRQVAVITGASSGIGAEFARQLAPVGMGLVLVARRRQRLERLAEHLAGMHGVPVEIVVCDLADRNALEALAVQLAARSDIELLVSNAGLGLVGRFAASDPARQIYQLDLHVIASTRLTRAVLPQMAARRGGAIVQVSSLAGVIPRLSSPTYGPSKAYLNAFSEALEGELAGSGICLQALCPGFTRTEFHSTPEYAGVDVHARVPAFLWLSAEQVVQESLAGLAKGKRRVIPGSTYRWLAAVGGSGLAQGIAARWRAARRQASRPHTQDRQPTTRPG
jgi:short-subunit dehydrogenase